MGGEQQVRYMVIERYADRRVARPAPRITLFDDVEEASVEVRGLERRSGSLAAELIGVDATGRLTTLWSSAPAR